MAPPFIVTAVLARATMPFHHAFYHAPCELDFHQERRFPVNRSPPRRGNLFRRSRHQSPELFCDRNSFRVT